jgi:DNA processing protein
MNDIAKLLNALNLTGIGQENIGRLLETFVDPSQIFASAQKDIQRSGINEKMAAKLQSKIGAIDPEKEWKRLEDLGIKTVTVFDEDYPPLLREIFLPPSILYYKGELFDGSKNIGIVGTRKPTPYGIDAAKQICKELCNAGFTLISGLAHGIDTVAHQTAVNEGAFTGAILGSSLDNIYPPQNEKLAKKIEENGFVMSEYPLGTEPFKYNFPQRNRIISGLSLGIVVVEAKEKSGALITANFALEQGREVFAVPGQIFSKNSKGPHDLIKLGAKLIDSARDIATELNIETEFDNPKNNAYALPTEQQIIIEILKEGPLGANEIIKISRHDASVIGSLLTIMELEGKIKKLTSGEFIINE